MLHMLAAHHREEFLAAPGLARLTMALGPEGMEATCLLKAPTLTLKYCISSAKTELVVIWLATSRVAYGIRVHDDPSYPSTHWSVIETEDELEALELVLKGESFQAFLFNELVVNVAGAECLLQLPENTQDTNIGDVVLGKVDHDDYAEEVSASLRKLESGEALSGRVIVFEVVRNHPWKVTTSHYITNNLSQSLVSISSEHDEGAQQEEVALWLIDGLSPEGAVRGPVVHEEGGERELSDLLLSYERGSFLIESKTLSIFSRETLPDRKKLAKGVKKHLAKAVKQLVGGLKNLRRELPVTDGSGQPVEANMSLLPHAIVLVPDLYLLADDEELGGSYFLKVAQEAEAYFHILDPVALFRHVQAAHMLVDKSESGDVTPMMAFDCVLLERFKVARDQQSPCFEMIFRAE